MRISRLVLLLQFFFFLSTSTLLAQQISVYSKESGRTLPFAGIIIKTPDGKSIVTSALDENGKFSLSDFIADNKAISFPIILKITLIGYEDLTDTLQKPETKSYSLQVKSHDLDEVVITAQYLPGSSEKSMYKIKVIDRKKIDAMAAVTLNDVLSNEMDIRLAQDNVLGSSMSIQGIGGEHVKILVDGIPVIGRLNGNIDLSQINLMDAERIEIVEGPLSVNYGSNAIAGTVNVITKKKQEKKVNASLTSYTENTGTYDFSGSAGIKIGKTQIGLSGGRNYFDGWNKGDYWIPDFHAHTADSSRHKSWKPREQKIGSASISHNIDALTVGYRTEYFYEKITNLGYPRAPYLETAFDESYMTNRTSQSVFANGNLNKKWFLDFNSSYGTYKRIKNTYIKDLTNLEKTLTSSQEEQDTTKMEQRTSRASASHSAPDAVINYEMGYDYSYDNIRGNRLENKFQKMSDYALFASTEIKPIPAISFKPALRIAYNTRFAQHATPSLNIRFQKNKFIARFSYGQGFRAPSLKELHFYFVDINHNIKGNPELKAESSNSYSISISRKSLFHASIFQHEFTLYYNSIHNLITLVNSSASAYSYVNIGSYKTTGIDLKETYSIAQLKMNIGFSLMGTYDSLASKSFAGRLNYSRALNFSTLYEIPGIEASVGLFYKFQGSTPYYYQNTNSEILSARAESYHTADISFSKSLMKKKCIISTGIKNAFNVTTLRSGLNSSVHSTSANETLLSTGRLGFLKITLSL